MMSLGAPWGCEWLYCCAKLPRNPAKASNPALASCYRMLDKLPALRHAYKMVQPETTCRVLMTVSFASGFEAFDERGMQTSCSSIGWNHAFFPLDLANTLSTDRKQHDRHEDF